MTRVTRPKLPGGRKFFPARRGEQTAGEHKYMKNAIRNYVISTLLISALWSTAVAGPSGSPSGNIAAGITLNDALSLPDLGLVLGGRGMLSPLSTFVVKSSADTHDIVIGDGVCADPLGNCTLRAAIEESNAHPGLNSIGFSIGSGPALIVPLTPLPFITESLIIDGTTQPGYMAQPLIEINGGADPEMFDCLYFSGVGGSTVRALNIHGFRKAIAFDAPGTTGGNVVEGNYIGTDPTGSIAFSNTTGLYVNSRGNRIGGLLPGQMNVISGNHLWGIHLADSNNVVQGNLIGVNALGTGPVSPLSGGMQVGVRVESSTNVIGGTSAAARNIISGGNSTGVIVSASPAPLSASGNIVQGNYIGTDINGTTAVGNHGAGIRILTGGTNNTIGGSGPGAGNLVSGNLAIGGINIEDAGVSGNRVQGNKVGTNVDGSTALPNVGSGIDVRNTSSNTIGGLGAGNLISGNQLAGITISACSSIFIQDNYIGTAAAGTTSLANGNEGVRIFSSNSILVERNLISGNHLDGLGIEFSNNSQIAGNVIGLALNGVTPLANAGSGIALNASSSNVIGGSSAGAGNIVSGNTRYGIVISGSSSANDQILGDRIGTDFSATLAVPNGIDGISLNNASFTIIGNSSASNIISGNNGNGISITGASATNNVAEGNLIGTDISGTLDLGNGQNGVIITNAPTNTIGAATAQGAANTISGNNESGVVVSGSGSMDNAVTGNRIGTNTAGTAALPNGVAGVFLLDAASSNRIGYLTPVAGTPPGNVISGQNRLPEGCGIRITGVGTRLNSVYGNLIGADASGTARLANLTGIQIDGGAAQNFIGEKVPNARNVISGNQLIGINMYSPGTDENQVQNDLIGTDITGAQPIGNGFAGVHIFQQAANNVVGGALPGSRNVISGTTTFLGISDGGGQGVLVESNAVSNLVQGNLIGTDLAGTSAIANAADGVRINSASNNFVGGDQPGTRNVISGNARNGVLIDNASFSNFIQNNSVGLKSGSLSPLPNAGDGIRISHTDGAVSAPALNSIGGPAPGVANVVAFNIGRGLMLLDGIKNPIISNSIFSNTGIGIDLSPTGPASNDSCDADSGPNGLQNYPTIDSAVNVAGATSVNLSLDSTASADYTIQIFVSDSCDPSGFGEGQTMVDTFTATTASSCTVDLNRGIVPLIPDGKFLTATATDAFGNTSEFSRCRAVGIPSAATGSIFGRVTTAAGNGISGAKIQLSGTTGEARTAVTGAFGYYQFDDLETGRTYAVSVSSKRFVFAVPTILVMLGDTAADTNFVSEP